LLSY